MSNMNLRVLASFTALLSYSAFAEFQSPLDEQWVLTKDKTTFLKNLTPGTDDYFFYHALHQQHLGLSEDFRRTMQGWQALYPKSVIPGPRAAQLRNRQTLLDYEAGIAGADHKLRSIFGIKQPTVNTKPGKTTKLPSTLDASAISSDAFIKHLGLNTDRDIIQSSTQKRLLRLAGSDKKWSKQNRDILLRRIENPAIPNIEKLILANFRDKHPLAITQIRCAKNLSHSQLKKLAQLESTLINDQEFVDLTIKSMQPDNLGIFQREPQKHLDWLTKLDQYTRTLPPSLNNLKAHVLYHRLRISAELDQYPVSSLERYLKLPRARNIIWRQKSLDARQHAISLTQDFRSLSACPPIGSETPLVEKYLLKVLKDATNRQALAEYFDTKYFKGMSSKAQLLAGIDSDRFDVDLSATDFEQLRDLRELSIAASTSRNWNPESKVSLNVDLKNIEQLTVSIYALDSLRYAKETGKEIGQDLDLSSMVPNTSRTIDTKESPFLRHRKVIELSELDDVGSWVIELHGNGQRATALIHKGELHHSVCDTGDGQEIYVSNYGGVPLKGVLVSVDGKDRVTNDLGVVQMPYSAYSSKSTMRLHLVSKDRVNGITRVVELSRRAAKTNLDLATISHPEQWLIDQKSTFYFKPSFLINGKPGNLKRIESSHATLTATLSDGQKVELAREEIKISLNDFLPIEFTVPKNLVSLELNVNCNLKPIAGRETPKVSASKQLAVSPVAETQYLAHHYFFQVDNEWFLQSRGRNGEPWPNKALSLSFKHRDFTRTMSHSLVTDESGVIKLGKLKGISRINVQASSESPSAALGLSNKLSSLPLNDYYQQGNKIELPTKYDGELNRYDFCLRKAGSSNKDFYSSLTLQGGVLSCGILPAGKYSLKTPYSNEQFFEVLDAATRGQWLTSRGHAAESASDKAIQIVRTELSNGKLTVQLSDSPALARIHIVASQFSETSTALQPSLPPIQGQSYYSFGFTPSIYTNGGTLSGEHQYIINRRLAGNKLGNMLARPAWLLQPWQTNTSESVSSKLEASKNGYGSGFGSIAKRKPSRKSEVHGNELRASSPVGFLENQAIVLANLTANKNGKFSINLNKLANHQRVDVIVTHGQHADSVRLALPTSKLSTIDQRLTRSLSTDKNFRASETHAVLKDGATAKIENIVDADWKAYSTLSDAYSYFYTHVTDDKHSEALRSFAPILNWPKLDQTEKLELLESAGSHELHLFIKNRDPEWFKAHIIPLLENKRRKQFLDHYLLDHDLSDYATVGKFHTLNTIEQALLAHRMQSESITNKVESDYLRIRPDTEADTELFTSLLKQGFDSDLDEIKRGLASQSTKRHLRSKLQNTIIPIIDFKNISVDQAIDILNSRARELDTIELDPTKKGVGFVLRSPSAVGGSSDEASEFAGAARPGSKIIRSLQLRDAPLEIVIKQICDMTKLRYKLENGRVVLLPATDFDDTELYTRSFKVPADLVQLLHSSDSDSFGNDPFAEASTSNTSLAATPPIKELLEQSGIVFPEGATASFNRRTGKLTIRNTANNLDLAGQLTSAIKAKPSDRVSSLELPASALAKRQIKVSANMESDLPSIDLGVSREDAPIAPSKTSDDPFEDEGSTLAPIPLVDPSVLPYETKAYAESYYFKRQSTEGKLSITPNAFWVDLAKSDGRSDFLSPHFAVCRDSTQESLIALALLDLPFEAVKPEITLDKNSMLISAKQAMILYYRDLKATQKEDTDSGLLCSLRYFRSGDLLSRDADGKISENVITGKFQSHTPYEAHLTITNPTGVEREVDILRQIPAGSIRLDSADNIGALRTSIAPHGSWKHIIHFYFPAEGSWQHYSPRVHEGSTLVSQLDDREIEVASNLPTKFTSSWQQLVSVGSNQEILSALKSQPLQQIEINYLDEHMSEAAFYTPAIKTLNERMVDSSTFVSHSIKHRDIDSLTHYLSNPKHCTNQFGYYFKSESLNTTPYSMREFDDTEWKPLINARSFSLTTENRITNEKVWADYLKLLTQLTWKEELLTEEKLTLAYHLFLHDRNSDAINLVADCRREDCDSKMQFDYITSYIHFLKGEPEKAAEIAQQWTESAKAPWDTHFRTVASQADQIANAALLKPQEKSQQAEHSWSASLNSSNTLRIDHKQMKDVVVQVYPVDLEFLFSNSPFLSTHDANYKAIRPIQELIVKLDQQQPFTEFKLPDSYQTGNRLLVIDDGEKEWLHPLQSTQLSATINTGSGMLQTISQGKPVSRCYVKIYALTQKGEVEFFKDGHTDLRGMFDFRGHNVHAPAGVQSYAVFINHPDLGGITKIIGDARPNTD